MAPPYKKSMADDATLDIENVGEKDQEILISIMGEVANSIRDDFDKRIVKLEERKLKIEALKVDIKNSFVRKAAAKASAKMLQVHLRTYAPSLIEKVYVEKNVDFFKNRKSERKFPTVRNISMATKMRKLDASTRNNVNAELVKNESQRKKLEWKMETNNIKDERKHEDLNQKTTTVEIKEEQEDYKQEPEMFNGEIKQEDAEGEDMMSASFQATARFQEIWDLNFPPDSPLSVQNLWKAFNLKIGNPPTLHSQVKSAAQMEHPGL